MKHADLTTIEYIIDEIVEDRVRKEMKQFYDNIKKNYPNLQYDLRKASANINDSAFDVLVNGDDDQLGSRSRGYVSQFVDPNFQQKGLGLKEPVRFQMTQEDYDAGKRHSDIPVSAFDGLTATDTPYDRSFFKKDTYVPTREELDRVLRDKPYLMPGLPEDRAVIQARNEEIQKDLLAKVMKKGKYSTETTLTLKTETPAEHHDKVLASVINLSKG